MRGDPTNDTDGAQCKARETLRGHAKKQYSLRGRVGTDTPTRRCHERYRDEDMQGSDTPCEDVCANDTRTRSHHERYRDEDVWETILPRGHAKKRYSLRGRAGERYPMRGAVTNDTVTSHPYWRAEPCEAGSVPYVRACSSVTIQLVHQTGTLKSKRRQQGSQKDGMSIPFYTRVVLRRSHDLPVTCFLVSTR